MKIIYLNCASGISGDMFLGALVDAGVPLAPIQDAIGSLGIPGLHLHSKAVKRCGIQCKKVSVHTQPEHEHRHLKDILAMIDGSQATDGAKKIAGDIFRKLAEAEAKVHGTTVDHVHFHEVGAADSIADILGAAVGLDYLKPDAIHCSPVPTGCGTVKIAHGNIPVPAPATAELLRGVPIQASDIPFELTTPTGAAILAVSVHRYGPMPDMTVEQTGKGAGDRDLEQQPNMLQIFIGDSARAGGVNPPVPPTGAYKAATTLYAPVGGTGGLTPPALAPQTDEIWTLATNLDDISAEMIGYCMDRLWELDPLPLDVFATPILMKKNRPGTQLTVLCRAEQIQAVEQILFMETGTLGIRRWPTERTVLVRELITVQTPFGEVTAKRSTLPDGSQRITPEYDSARAAAMRHQVPLERVYAAVADALSQL